MHDKVHLNLKFSGPALEQGTMDVRDLAPALLGLGQVFDTANLILNSQQEKIGVEIKATERGSFSIDLNVFHVASQAVSFLNSPGIIALLNAAGIITIIWGTLKIIQKIAGKKIDKIETLQDKVVLHVENITYNLTLNEYRLFQDLEFRQAISKTITEPLSKDGIEDLKMSSPEIGEISINKSERDYFIVPKVEGEILIDELVVKAFSIVSLTFKEDNKWRLSDGNSTISVLIQDEIFLKKIDQGEKFGKNDVLVCEVRVLQRQTPEGIKTDYIVLKVREHKPAARQMVLDLKG